MFKHKPWDHEIKLEFGKTSDFGPIYALFEKETEALDKYLNKMFKKGFIRKFTSSCAHPLLFVFKKDGELRPCIDYRKLNVIIIKNRYPLPLISEMQDRLKGAKRFTILDQRGAYNLIRMKEGEEWKTAFRIKRGIFEYLVMPFGLTNAPATCQELINDILKKYIDIFVVVYLDDILIFSANEKEHEEHVKKVLAKLEKYDIQLKPEKCHFNQKEVAFLEFKIGIKGITIDPAKVKAVLEWPAPTTVKEVQAFLGLASYNRRFVPDFSKIAIALTRLIKKDEEWA